MSKHTPGPWTVDECLDAQGFSTIRHSDGTGNGNTELGPVATVYTEKHATLIASAPAMYEALKAVYAVLNVKENFRPGSQTVGAIELAEAALAQADDERRPMIRAIKTPWPCHCKKGIQRDNCPQCEGTGKIIIFRREEEIKPCSSHKDK